MTAHLSIVPTPVVPRPEGGWEPLEPGVYYDIPEAQYFTDPAFSSSGSRTLLDKTPAVFDYEREHGTAETAAMTFGSALHTLVLRAGPDIQVIEADSWRTNAAKDARSAAQAAGRIPLLKADHDTAQVMAEAVHNHRDASLLLTPGAGVAEVTIVWDDSHTGIRCKARVDWLWGLNVDAARRLIIVDYKTAVDARTWPFGRKAADFGYHRQLEWYRMGVQALGLGDNPDALLIVQEKHPPYQVRVVRLGKRSMDHAHRKNVEALALYAECEQAGEWPDYGSGIEEIELPIYH